MQSRIQRKPSIIDVWGQSVLMSLEALGNNHSFGCREQVDGSLLIWLYSVKGAR
jgi:hypothetical protein